MRPTLLFILFALSIPFAKGQTIAIPDTNFFKALVLNGVDANSNGKIDSMEASVTTQLLIQDLDIVSLNGIEYFPNLLELNCHHNKIDSLDLSKNVLLESLNVSSNPLTAIDLQFLVQLKTLDCSANNMETLDVSANKQLIRLLCNQNLLTRLDVSKNTQLTYLNASLNTIQEIDLTQNGLLAHLEIQGNKFKEIDISKNEKLAYFDCANNLISGLDVSVNSMLTSLACEGNALSVLDLSKNKVLSFFGASSNQLSSLNIVGLTTLKNVFCRDNLLTTLDFSTNPDLQILDCSQNFIKTLDVSKNVVLSHLECQENRFLKTICVLDISVANLFYTKDATAEWTTACSLSTSLSLHQVNATQVFIFPNPAKDFIQINTDVTSVNVLNLAGERVLQASTSLIDIHSLEKGIYMVHVVDNNSNQRVVKLVCQ